MPTPEIHALSELRDEAAGLLRERYVRQRAAEPLLPEVEDFEPHLPAEGLVATRGGAAVAYLAGAVENDTAWVRFGGCAATEPEALRDLFAELAAGWEVQRYQVAVPAADEALRDVFFRLAFGCQAVWAIREAEQAEPVDFEGTIRRATAADAEAAVDVIAVLYEHQAATPSFSGWATPSREERLREAAECLADDTYVEIVAERDGQIVGWLSLYRRPEGDLRVPPGNIDLTFAATVEDVRGSGVGLALNRYALAWAVEHGCRSVTVDWRMVNLLSSRFWPRRGFRPQYLRLYRAVP
jgi:GNAT superfamily N-acetyltransferase